jgi:hypothetical protein
MTNIQNGWYYAVGARACFTFQVMDGMVVTAPPYGWKFLGGRSPTQGMQELRRAGFTIHSPTMEEA